MTTTARNRLLVIGSAWGLLLASLPAFVMTEPFRLSGFLAAALICAVLGGCAGALAAGRRAASRGARGGLLASLVTGLFQGLVGGAVAAFSIFALMAVTLSGFAPGNPGAVADLMSPRVFLGSFFVALSAFIYALLGGLLLGPGFGTLVNRAVRVRSNRGEAVAARGATGAAGEEKA